MNKNGYCLEFLENSGSIKLTDPNGRVIVEQYPAAEGLTFSQISSNADGISFLLTSDSLEKPLLCDGFCLVFHFETKPRSIYCF